MEGMVELVQSLGLALPAELSLEVEGLSNGRELCVELARHLDDILSAADLVPADAVEDCQCEECRLARDIATATIRMHVAATLLGRMVIRLRWYGQPVSNEQVWDLLRLHLTTLQLAVEVEGAEDEAEVMGRISAATARVTCTGKGGAA